LLTWHRQLTNKVAFNLQLPMTGIKRFANSCSVKAIGDGILAPVPAAQSGAATTRYDLPTLILIAVQSPRFETFLFGAM